LLRALGVPKDKLIALVGPSALGLADPADGGAISLYQVTVVLCCAENLNLDRLVGLRILGLLIGNLGKEALAANERAEQTLEA